MCVQVYKELIAIFLNCAIFVVSFWHIWDPVRVRV